jgi:hypothetical protein
MSKNKKIIIASILGLIILSLISTVIFQTAKAIKTNSRALVFQKKELVLLENKIKDLEEFEKEYKTYKGELEKINKLFIEPENPVEFINFLNFLRKTATDSEVAINISPPSQKKEVSSEPWPYITFQISGAGKFKNVIRFLEKIENSPYLIEISGLSLKIMAEAEKKSSPGEISANLFLKAFTTK